MYQLIFEKQVFKDLDKVPRNDLTKIQEVFKLLKSNPRLFSNAKLKGAPNRYRIRKGDYRIIYINEDISKTVKIMLVRHRRDIYRKQ